MLKCNLDIGRYVPQAHGVSVVGAPTGGGGGGVKLWKGWYALTGLGQENLLGFLLFWIGSYALIHGAPRTYSLTRTRIAADLTSVRLNADHRYAWVYGTWLLALRAITILAPRSED